MFVFELSGKPIPQKQTRFGHGHAYNPSKQDEDQVKWQIKPTAPSKPILGAIAMDLYLFFPIPKSASKALRLQMVNRAILPTITPDSSNCLYFYENALKNLVYMDDKQICVHRIYKYYGEEPKTVIRIKPILQAQPIGYMEVDDEDYL